MAERRVRNEADAQLTQQRQQFLLRIPGPQRVLRLHSRDGVNGMGAADRGRGSLGQPNVSNLALDNQIGQRAYGVLDGCLRIDAVLVVQVDTVCTKPLQRSLDRNANVRRAAVENAGAATGMRDQPKFRSQDDLVAAALDGSADQVLVGVGP